MTLIGVFKIPILLLMVVASVTCSGSDNDFSTGEGDGSVEPTPDQFIEAFPGAEGGGMYTSGGRAGKVLYVTKLEDSSFEGTLRWAINQTGARTILFKVSGLIELKSELKIKNGDLTIAGQTAPGDGICISNYPVTVDTDNVIIRYIRVRMGDAKQVEGDAFWGRYRKNIIVDHCSVSWSTDECSSFYGNENFTMQWCIISESLKNSVHGKGNHGYGAIWGGINATYHHNLLAHHDSRNPRFDHQALYPNTINRGDADFRNNVVYNWGGNSTYGGEGGRFNMVGNYYKPGPASRDRQYFIVTNGKYMGTVNGVPNVVSYPGHAKLFMDGNHHTKDNVGMNSNNWNGVSVTHDGGSEEGMHLTTALDIKLGTKFCTVKTHSASTAYEKVLNYAGASLFRDKVDTRAISDTRSGTATITNGGNGSIGGLIDTQTAVGGWDTYNSTTAPIDTDSDGMPDSWEQAKGLDKNSITDGSKRTLDKNYTNLEMYLNSIVESTTNSQKQ